VVEHLPTIWKAMHPIPSIAEEKKEGKEDLYSQVICYPQKVNFTLNYLILSRLIKCCVVPLTP
jgi:hypothetical protein